MQKASVEINDQTISGPEIDSYQVLLLVDITKSTTAVGLIVNKFRYEAMRG